MPGWKRLAIAMVPVHREESVAKRLITAILVGALSIWLLGPTTEVRGGQQADAPRLTAAVIAKLTGPESLNETGAWWNVYGTDLGHMFEHEDRLFLVFGDTYRDRKRAWRSNVMAWTEDDNPRDGLSFDGMITAPSGHAQELLPSRKIWGWERTVIPTYGVSVGGRMFLHYMSVRYWGRPG